MVMSLMRWMTVREKVDQQHHSPQPRHQRPHHRHHRHRSCGCPRTRENCRHSGVRRGAQQQLGLPPAPGPVALGHSPGHSPSQGPDYRGDVAMTHSAGSSSRQRQTKAVRAVTWKVSYLQAQAQGQTKAQARHTRAYCVCNRCRLVYYKIIHVSQEFTSNRGGMSSEVMQQDSLPLVTLLFALPTSKAARPTSDYRHRTHA